MRIALCVARFYPDLADALVGGAQAALEGHETEVLDVPGAFELPLAARFAARAGVFDGVVCLGAVIRGETDHYDWVCAETARGVQSVQLETEIPCGFGVLTCDTYEQALARAGQGRRDTGGHAAAAVLALLEVKSRLGDGARVRPRAGPAPRSS